MFYDRTLRSNLGKKQIRWEITERTLKGKWWDDNINIQPKHKKNAVILQA